MIDQMEAEGYLETEPEHKTIRLTPAASDVLFRGKTVEMLVRKEKEQIPHIPLAAKLSSDDADLYDTLRELRSELAKEAGIPAYVVFSNATLMDMAKKKPKTKVGPF
jgi:ATP-dependent DNA helicase RecQ